MKELKVILEIVLAMVIGMGSLAQFWNTLILSQIINSREDDFNCG